MKFTVTADDIKKGLIYLSTLTPVRDSSTLLVMEDRA
jgi:hypothetical protein